MKYQISKVIGKEGIKLLKSILDKKIKEIYLLNYSDVTNFAFEMIITTIDKNIIIENKEIMEKDKEEYFNLDIREYLEKIDEKKYYKMPFYKKIETIKILHNEIIWRNEEENEWDIKADTRITFISEEKEKLYIQPIDSLANFLLVTKKEEKLSSIPELWKFKIDEEYIVDSREEEVDIEAISE